MFRLIFPVLVRIPVEADFSHAVMVSRTQPSSHINVWLVLRLPAVARQLLGFFRRSWNDEQKLIDTINTIYTIRTNRQTGNQAERIKYQYVLF